MPRLLRSLLFAFVGLLATTVSHAQKTPATEPSHQSGINGIVKGDGDNRPIYNAKVQVTTATGEIVNSVYTGDDGRFSFIYLSKGEYVVTVTAKGYETVTQSVTILGTGVPEVDLSLRKSANPGENAPTGADSVSSRELMLPQKAQEALHKGIETLYKKNNPSGSLSYFQTVLKLAPNYYEAYYHEGMAYTFESKPADAETAFKKAIELSQDSYPDADFGLAAMLSDHDRFKEAEGLSRHGLLLQPDSWRGDLELARALDGLGHSGEAEGFALEARKKNPAFPGLYIVLANIHLQLHNDNALVEDLAAYLRIDPNGPFAAQARDLKAKTEKVLNSKSGPAPPHQN
jgi:hypothetical protein